MKVVMMCACNVQAAPEVVDSWPSHVRELISVQELGLADLQSVEEAVKNILDKHPTIDVLLNNAGIMTLPTKKQTTKQDIELKFGTNHVGAEHLDEQLTDNIDSVSLHPGVNNTNLWQYFPKFVRPLTKLFAEKTVEQGAATRVYCCLAKNVEGAAYYSDCQVAEPTATAKDARLRKESWDYMEELNRDSGFALPKALDSSSSATPIDGGGAAAAVVVAPPVRIPDLSFQ